MIILTLFHYSSCNPLLAYPVTPQRGMTSSLSATDLEASGFLWRSRTSLKNPGWQWSFDTAGSQVWLGKCDYECTYKGRLPPFTSNTHTHTHCIDHSLVLQHYLLKDPGTPCTHHSHSPPCHRLLHIHPGPSSSHTQTSYSMSPLSLN